MAYTDYACPEIYAFHGNDLVCIGTVYLDPEVPPFNCRAFTIPNAALPNMDILNLKELYFVVVVMPLFLPIPGRLKSLLEVKKLRKGAAP